jgi:hypothetical protein
MYSVQSPALKKELKKIESVFETDGVILPCKKIQFSFPITFRPEGLNFFRSSVPSYSLTFFKQQFP